MANGLTRESGAKHRASGKRLVYMAHRALYELPNEMKHQ